MRQVDILCERAFSMIQMVVSHEFDCRPYPPVITHVVPPSSCRNSIDQVTAQCLISLLRAYIE